MPYTIQTKDGITLANIPDEVRPDDDRLKQLVKQKRELKLNESRNERKANMRAENPAEYDSNSAEWKEKHNPANDMTGFDKVRANIGAGMSNFGRGLAQLALPKSMEADFGITDQSTLEKRGMDQNLANSTTGGKALQIAGEAAPMMVLPGGAISRGLGMLPKVGAAVKGAGIGSRVLPTIMAEGAVGGAASGAITPTTSDESVAGNMLMGGLGGAAAPALLYGAGKAVSPFIKSLSQRTVAKRLGEEIDVSPAAQKSLEKAIKKSEARIVDAPQSTATLTQSPQLAQLELAARANPDSAPGWQASDEIAKNAKWKALDDALGSEATVQSAKEATDAFSSKAVPEFFKTVKPKELSNAVTDFGTAVRDKMTKAVGKADKAGQQVYGTILRQLRESDKSAMALWNIRQNIKKMMEASPAPGRARAPKLDERIMEATSALDATLNRASGGKWSGFLDEFGGYLRKEGEQKAGSQIRNAFFNEVLSQPRGATTGAGNPAVTRAALEKARANLSTNKFGDRLNWEQANVVDQVLGDLRAEEILSRAKLSMTGGGGSQTAPLAALLKRQGNGISGGWFTDLAQAWKSFGSKKQGAILNDILQSPEDALVIMRQAEKIKRPLSLAEKKLVDAARVLVTGPSALTLAQAGNAHAN